MEILRKFVEESNAIEQIFREPTSQEINELNRFINLPIITLEELNKFISIYQPNAKLRDQYGLNVRVGDGTGKYYLPPFGGPQIKEDLIKLLLEIDNYNAWEFHVKYECLHPFTDGNGRSGRAIWAWKTKDLSYGFLLKFYLQTLQQQQIQK